MKIGERVSVYDAFGRRRGIIIEGPDAKGFMTVQFDKGTVFGGRANVHQKQCRRLKRKG